jgi:hypothetical protein
LTLIAGALMPKKTKAYQDGLRAFEQKDYDKAFRLLIRYAEGGDSEAQATPRFCSRKRISLKQSWDNSVHAR